MESKLLCKPIMLHTKETGAFAYTKKYGIMYLNSPVDFQQHLYLISDREIKEGNYIYDVRDGYLGKHSGLSMHPDYEKTNYRKVEATTDKSLGLPLIPQSFIKKYVQKQGKINNVYIRTWQPDVLELSDDAKEIIILPVKNNWTANEVKRLVAEYHRYLNLHGIGTTLNFNEWFDKNY